MSSTRYERVAAADDDAQTSITPNSPPPSFRSRDNSPRPSRTANRHVVEDPNLEDAFGADGSDSDEENDGDDRQRLMRGTPTDTSSAREPASPADTHPDAARAEGPIHLVDTRDTHVPAFAPAVQGRVYGGGSSSDGVFANLSAKPERGEKVEEHPPTYEQAAADAAPPYWETTILAPGAFDPNEVYIDGLAVGSFFSFMWNAMISMSFQIVGFLLTYLLHTTHAAKNGSRAGLGVTLIQYGFYMKGDGGGGGGGSGGVPGDGSGQAPSDPDNHDFDPNEPATGGGGGDSDSMAGSEFVAYALMIVGWFILIRSVSEFLRARRHEQLVLQSPDRGLGTAVIAEGERDSTVV